MTVFTADEIAGLQSAQESFMQDTCQVGVRGSSQDALGELVDTFTYQDESAANEGRARLEETGDLRTERRREVLR